MTFCGKKKASRSCIHDPRREKGHCKSWTLDFGIDSGLGCELDYGLDYGLNFLHVLPQHIKDHFHSSIAHYNIVNNTVHVYTDICELSLETKFKNQMKIFTMNDSE